MTGTKFLRMNVVQVNSDSSRPAARANVGSNCLIINPIGMKYMLAMLCSNPAATNAVIGKMIAAILSTVLRALKVSQTARQTRVLQRIPRVRA